MCEITKNTEINTDSLWIIDERDKSGKHSNYYHGNFIPQIPNQLIKRYTKENDTILDIFMGSGTTLFECEALNRKFIGFENFYYAICKYFEKYLAIFGKQKIFWYCYRRCI